MVYVLNRQVFKGLFKLNSIFGDTKSDVFETNAKESKEELNKRRKYEEDDDYDE